MIHKLALSLPSFLRKPLLALLFTSPLVPWVAQADTVFLRTGLDGAGFQNVIAVDPFDASGRTILLGGDTTGLSRSIDRGQTFDPANLSAQGGSVFYNRKRSVASIVFGPSAGLVYVGAGSNYNNGVLRDGGFYRSLDSGVTWEFRSGVPQFWGRNKSNELTGAPAEHPRPTGKLIAINSLNDIFVGTFRDGVMRSTVADGGATWASLGRGSSDLSGKYIRGICQPAHRPSHLLVGTYGQGAWLSTNVNAAATDVVFIRQTGAPEIVEELVSLGTDDRIYAVCGSAGVYQVQIDGDSTVWTRIGGASVKDITNTPTDTPRWTAIDGFVSGQNVTLYIGADQPFSERAQAQSIMKATSSTNSFTFASVTTVAPDPYTNAGSGVHYTLASADGATSTPWWFAPFALTSMLNRGSFVAAQIAVGPNNPDHVYVAGKSGAWRSINAGVDWHPIVAGLQASFNRTVVVDPNIGAGQRVYIGNTDFTFLFSPDGMATIKQVRPSGSGSIGTAIALDTSTGSGVPSRVHLATCGGNLNREGEVFHSDDPLAAAPIWNSHGLGAAMIAAGIFGERQQGGRVVADPTTGPRVLGLAFRKVGATSILIAAVDGGGVWRKTWTNDVASGAWSRVNSVAMGIARDPIQTSLVWPTDNVLFLHDRKTGLWRSNDQGASWTSVWSEAQVLDGGDSTGFLSAEVHGSSEVRLFLSMKSRLWRINGAHTGNSASWDRAQIGVGTLENPGPTVFMDGQLWITDSGNPPRFYKATQLQTASPAIVQEDVAGGGGINYYAISTAAEGPAGLASVPGPDASVIHYIVGNGAIRSGAPASSDDAGRLVNLSVRAFAGAGERTLIAGFTLAGTGAKPLVIRGVGPGLAAFGVHGTIPDPRVAVFANGEEIVANDNWSSDDGRQLGAFALGAGSRDAVVANVFAAAGYTAQVSGVGGTTGDAIMELYDGAPANSGVRLVNLSTRTQLDDGERLIVGFTLAGSTSKSLILRAVGPTLAAFGLPAAHPDPRIELYSADAQIAANAQWQGEDGRGVGAFPLAAGSKDAVVARSLPPGGYTLHVVGAPGASGIVLVEVYEGL